MTLRQRVSRMSDKTLNRILGGAVAALVAIALVFGGVYYLGQHVNKGPSLVSRQVASAEQAVRAAPSDIQARLRLASVYKLAKRYRDALKQYDEILRAVPGQRAALLGRGDVLMAKGELDAAKATLKEITAVAAKGEFAGADTQLEQAFYYLGSIALRQGNVTEAVTNLESALHITRTDADALYLLGVAQLKQGKAKAAVDAVRRALLFVPVGWCQPYTTLGEAYRRLGRQPQAQYADGMLAFCEKRLDEAARTLTPLVTGPAAVDAMVGLGMVAQQQSRRDEAIAWYRKALARDPNNSSALYGLSWLGAPTASTSPSSSPQGNR